MISLSYLISSLIIIVIPGTGVIYTISTGLTEGKRRSIYAALGCTLGIVPHLFLSTLMSVMIFEFSDILYNIIKYTGLVYLIFLGLQMIFDNYKIDIAESGSTCNKGRIIRRAVLINLLNPKLTLFFFSFLPQYIDSDKNSKLYSYIFLGALFMLMTFVVFCIYGLLADYVRRLIQNSSKSMLIIRRISGLMFLLFSIKVVI